jgi:RNA polymerase sigma factor (sigma-70 family)
MARMPDDTDLGGLMARAQAGDSEAYRELLDDLVPRVRRLVLRQRSFLASQEIDDLTQDILLSVHVARATYDPARPFLPWLMAITRNRLADAARSYAFRGLYEVLVADVDVTFPTGNANPPTEEYRDPEALHRAVQALPSGQRTAIELLKLQGLSLKEAASTSGTSIGALKVATYRAMNALRKMLKADG